MARTYHPTRTNIIVRRSKAPKTNAAGVIIEAAAHDYGPYEGTVIALGPGVTADPGWQDGSIYLRIEKGSRVVFTSYSTLTSDPEANTLLVKQEDILAVIVDDGVGAA